MKLFQKVAATVLAAVLALSTLTACGGGGGGGSAAAGYRLQKLLNESQKSGQVYTELDLAGMGTVYLAKDAQSEYLKTKSATDIADIEEFVKKGEKSYELNETTKKYEESSTEGFAFMRAFLPQEAYLARIQIVPEYDIAERKLYAEVVDLGAAGKLVYCFNADKLTYIVKTEQGEEADAIAVQVKEWKASIPQDVQGKMNLTGYTEIGAGEQLFPTEG